MAPDAGGVTMVLPEAQEQEKGGPGQGDAAIELTASASDNVEEQNGLSGATDQAMIGQLGHADSTAGRTRSAIEEEHPDSGSGPEPDQESTITVDTIPPTLMVGIDSGPLQPAPLTAVLQDGSTHMLYTVSPQPPNPADTRYRFDRWIGGPATLAWNVTINGSRTYVASFVTQYRIEILTNVPGPQLGSDIPGCDMLQPAPIYCWVDEGFPGNLLVPSPQGDQYCRFVFLSWSDGDLRTVRPIGPVMGPATYVAIFSAECVFTLKDNCTGNPPFIAWMPMMEFVQLGWTPPTGLPPRERYRFKMWIGEGPGNYTGPDPNATIIIFGAITETATCYHEFRVTIDTSPTSIDFTVDDVNYNGLTSLWWENQSMHWLNLTVLNYELVLVRYAFTQWSDGVFLSQRRVFIDAPEDYVAFYSRMQVKLSLSPPIIGDIRCVEHTDCWYDLSEPATAQVTSPWTDGGGGRYEFVQWSGDASGTDTSVQLLMIAPMTAVAEWRIFFHLTVFSLYGDPHCSNADCWYLNGTTASVTLEDPFVISTDTRQKFIGWGMDTSGTSNPLMLTMNAAKEVSAAWEPQFLLTIVSECSSITDCGSPTGAGWYDEGTDATVALSETVNVNGGTRCIFTEWSGGASGTDDQVDVTMDTPLTVTANWAVQFLLTVASDCGGSAECEEPTGEGWYNNQSVASLTVNSTFTDTSGSVWDFNGWTGDASGKELHVAVLMDSPKAVTATWVKKTPSQQPAPFPTTLIVIAAILLAVILAALLLFYLHRKRAKDEESSQKGGREEKKAAPPTNPRGGEGSSREFNHSLNSGRK